MSNFCFSRLLIKT